MAVAIVGQGVAGTLLGFELERRGIDFKIIDSGKNHSSSIAAGIMNPVVFRRLTKSWMLDDCWDLAIQTYQELEKKLGVSFLHVKPMRRLFASDQEAGFWHDKTKRPDFERFIAPFSDDDPCPSYAKNNFGNGLVKSVHHIDVLPFLAQTRQYFENQGKMITQEVDYLALQESLNQGEYESIIFCQGYQNFENPFFQKLPVQTTKGQILTIKNEEISEAELLNRKCFLLPLGDSLFRVGATYEWENTSLNTTDAARKEISEKLESLIDSPFEVVAQHAGIRPTSPDRRPIIGAHPVHKNMFILNGLGTKGYLIAPWCVKQLSEHIYDNKALMDVVNLKRFEALL
jgi:glycine/D-amino acid oxidase-like deaminating enzyme